MVDLQFIYDIIYTESEGYTIKPERIIMKLFDRFRKKPKEEPKELIVVEQEEDLTPRDFSSNVKTSDHICGLYFMTTMTMVDGKEVYAVKIGRSEDIGKRMYMYRTHTPFAVLGGVCEVRRNLLSAYEEICHLRLHQYAIPHMYCAGEWEIVSKEDYEELCRWCNTDVGFRKKVNEWVAC